MRPSHALALTALLFVPLLTGCGSQGPISVTKYQHFTTPPELRECKQEPTVPQLNQDSDFAGYVLDLRDAGQDCREKLNRRNEVEDAVK